VTFSVEKFTHCKPSLFPHNGIGLGPITYQGTLRKAFRFRIKAHYAGGLILLMMIDDGGRINFKQMMGRCESRRAKPTITTNHSVDRRGSKVGALELFPTHRQTVSRALF
jgi:hypothetical protein